MHKAAFGAPETLANARTVAHAATQLLYRASVANVAPMPADEHTNLGWNSEAAVFETHPLGESVLMVRLRLSPLAVQLGENQLELGGVTPAEALAWLDSQLSNRGLKPASAISVSYDLPHDVSDLSVFERVDGLETLAEWFDLAASSLQAFAQTNADIQPGPSPVRCWPHHFDIATYVSLEAGDPEKARGIGVGMSPGDGSYEQPYFYVNPWPYLSPDALPSAVTPGHWHTEGFVGMIATGSEILTVDDVRQGTATFLQRSFETGCVALGI